MKVNSNALIRWSTILAVVLLAIGAGWASYDHIYWVVTHHGGQTGIVAKIYPATVDGLVYTTSMVLLDHARRRLTPPALAYWLLASGILATLAANVWDGFAYGLAGMIIAAWPAPALVGSYEMLMRIIRGQARDKLAAERPESLAHPQEIADPPPDPTQAGPLQPKRHRHAAGHPTPEAAELAFSAELAKGEVPDVPLIMKKLHVGKGKAETYHAHFMQITQALR